MYQPLLPFEFERPAILSEPKGVVYSTVPNVNAAMNFAIPTPPSISAPSAPSAQPGTAPGAADATAASGPTTLTDPAKPAAPVVAPTIARQEEEARMLVSDLLEIGMAQRKAYEEAQKKAAESDKPATPVPGTE